MVEKYHHHKRAVHDYEIHEGKSLGRVHNVIRQSMVTNISLHWL